MYKLSRERILIILAICLAGFFFAVPNFLPRSYNLPSWWKTLSLGLDLQGGSNLLLNVDMDNVIKERLGLVEDSARQALREHRTRYRNLTTTATEVRVRIEDFNDRTKALSYLRNLEEGLEARTEDDTIVLTFSEQALKQLNARVIDQSIEIVRRRIDELGTKEPVIQAQGEGRIVVQLPGVQNPEEVKQLLGKTAKMSFHLVDSRTSLADIRRGKLSNTLMVLRGEDGVSQYVVTRKAAVGGENLTDAQVTFQDAGRPAVSFSFNTSGGRRFGEVTKNHVGEQLAIVLDNEVISAPTIQGAITGGKGVITGNFSAQEAQNLAMMLRSGALPAPLQVIEERTVGAGLGADSIRAGLLASFIGLVAVVVFMIAAYGLFGIFTTITLAINLLLMLGIMSVLGTTLTLPGIAGIILSIAMAVDANVLIFERMREEVKKGRTPKDAAETGFTEAWATIVDSNLTTLVAALVLFWLGSGPVRGFAVTLTAGIITSMFTSVTVARLIIAAWIVRCKPTSLPI